MMKLILPLLLVALIKADDAFLPPIRDLQYSSYTSVCTGKTNCYAIFLDTTKVAGQINWNNMPLYQSAANLWPSASWAHANSQAATFLWWLTEARSKGVSNINYSRWISYYSIEKAVLLTGNGVCCDVPSSSGGMRANFHEALTSVDSSTYNFYDVTNWPDPLDLVKACNTTYLSSVNTASYNPYIWTTYLRANFTTSKNPYSGISTALSSYGLGLVSIPFDWNMCCGGTLYSDGIYNPTNTTMYYDAATVWGVWKDTNSQIWLGVYVIGAYNKYNKYVWVPLSIVSNPNTISWLQTTALLDTSLW
uniref:Pre-progamone1 n=1 Tax=Blepharisma sp. EN-II TaxID=1481882 RepID=A0A0E4B3M8_9CILI|nr:pre-progamone1 [Blepharisma sp. EN-II]